MSFRETGDRHVGVPAPWRAGYRRDRSDSSDLAEADITLTVGGWAAFGPPAFLHRLAYHRSLETAIPRSVNSTPAASNSRRIAWRVVGIGVRRFFSKSLTVLKDTLARRARSACDQSSQPRAALLCIRPYVSTAPSGVNPLLPLSPDGRPARSHHPPLKAG